MKSLQITINENRNNLYNTSDFISILLAQRLLLRVNHIYIFFFFENIFKIFSTDSFIADRRSVTRRPLRSTFGNSDTSADKLGPQYGAFVRRNTIPDHSVIGSQGSVTQKRFHLLHAWSSLFSILSNIVR